LRLFLSQQHPQQTSSLLARHVPPTSELRRLVAYQNDAGGTYHHLDFGSGVVLEGDYDLPSYLWAYDLPADMRGLRVLDVGTATGFLALECAARGASVVAVDVFDHTPLVDLARILDLSVEYRKQSVYDLDPANGSFDRCVSGSLLLHLSDPILALRRMRSVCTGALHVTTACPKRWWRHRDNRCYFVGIETEGGEGPYYNYWELSSSALTSMLLFVGFAEVSRARRFVLRSRRGRTPWATHHVGVTAYAKGSNRDARSGSTGT
jgi:SAM-dependent methyltransferase